MFLKNVKKFFSKMSMTARLTLSYATATFFMLVLVAAFFYWSMINILYNNDKQFLQDEIVVVADLLQNSSSEHFTLQHEVQDVPKLLKNSMYHYAIRVLDQNNNVIIQTPGMKQGIDEAPFFCTSSKEKSCPTSLLIRGNPATHMWWFSPTGNKFLLMRSVFKNIKIQAALDVSAQHSIIVLCRKVSVTIVLLGELLAIFISYIIARRGLRRLQDLTSTTNQITATSLHQRIDTHYWPRELRRLGGAFNEMLNRIETAFSYLSEFSADLAHELRTPINNLLGEIEIALSHDGSKDEYRTVLESNIEELHRISQIIENLLFLARAENPHLELQKTSVNIKEEIESLCEYYEALAEEKDIKLICSGVSVDVKVERIMFRRAINNLICNGLKYTNAGGQIEIFIKSVSPNYVKIEIKDNGIGISHEHLPKIFNRFYRVDSARADHTGNVGLGLAIVKSIMHLHQGSVEIHSRVNCGTTFELEFPV